MKTATQQPVTLQKTPLWETHITKGGKMVDFAGYEMPVQYENMGVLKEHLHTREKAGLFDVSHMGQATLSAKEDPASALENLTPSALINLKPGEMKYTVLLNENGGIIDDLIVTRWDEHTLYLVVNASRKEVDFDLLTRKFGGKATLEKLENRALVALQGPKAEEVLAKYYPAVRDMTFMTAIKQDDLYISRSGYTGEDGFEISLPDSAVVDFTKKLLANNYVQLIGLGARDSLRMEAGLCLYGHDLDENTTPVEAGLKWTIGKRRREEKNFPGAGKILEQLENGAERIRIGLKPEGKAPIREGIELFSTEGKKIGIVTSGGFGVSAGVPVALGYVEAAYARTGTTINAMVRGIPRPCTISDLPFIPQKYKKG